MLIGWTGERRLVFGRDRIRRCYDVLLCYSLGVLGRRPAWVSVEAPVNTGT